MKKNYFVLLTTNPVPAPDAHQNDPDPHFSCFFFLRQISNVGYEHVDTSTVSDAVAGHTLFIHGSSVDTGNLAVLRAAETAREGNKNEENNLQRRRPLPVELRSVLARRALIVCVRSSRVFTYIMFVGWEQTNDSTGG